MGGHCERIAVPQPRRERNALNCRRSRRHGDNAIEVWVALQNADRVGEDQRLDRGIRPGSPKATDQWCRQQDIAKAALFLIETDFVTGESIRVDGEPYDVIGVAPTNFQFPMRADLKAGPKEVPQLRGRQLAQ